MLQRLALAFSLWLIAALSIASEKTVLRFATMENADTRPVLEKLVQEFEAENPDIQIKVEYIADEFFMRLLTQYAAGVAPDLAQINIDIYQPFAMRGALVPLDEFVKKTPEIDLKRWYPNLIQFYTYEGHLWGLPRDVAPFGLVFYNKTLFDQAGLKYPDGSWTWSYQPRPELREKCFTWVMQQLTKKDAKGKTTQFGFAPAWPQIYYHLLLLSRNLNMWDNDAAPTRITATDPEVVKLMEFAADCIVKKNWIPTWDQIDKVAQSDTYHEFVKGRIAMLLTFNGDVGRMRKDMAAKGWDWDVTIFPSYENEPRATKTDSSATVIFSTSKHKDEAWKFAAFMSGERGQRAYAKVGLQPAIRELAREPGLWLPGPGASAEAQKPKNLIVADEAAMAMKFQQTPEYFEDTKLYLDQAAFDILSGAKTPRETMERVTQEGQQRLDAARRKMPTDPFPTTGAVVFGVLAVGLLIAWVYWPERGKKLTQAGRRENASAYRFVGPTLLGLVVFTIGPILYSFFLSMSNSDMIRPPMWRGAQNYVDAFTVDPAFLKSIQVSFTYALMSIPIGLLFALSLALLLNVNVKGMPLFRSLYYLPSLVSGMATSLIWMRVFNPESGILNNILYAGSEGGPMGIGGAMSSWAGTPGQPVNWLANEHTALPAFVLMGLWGAGGGTIILLAGLQGIPQMYYEAAILDGAGPWQKFKAVTLPMLSPALFFSLITGTIGAIQAFTTAFVMTDGGPNNATMFYMLNLYIQGFKSLKMGYASALAWILFLIVLIITAVQFVAAKRWVYYEGGDR